MREIPISERMIRREIFLRDRAGRWEAVDRYAFGALATRLERRRLQTGLVPVHPQAVPVRRESFGGGPPRPRPAREVREVGAQARLERERMAAVIRWLDQYPRSRN
jgi:hypothetical protein